MNQNYIIVTEIEKTQPLTRSIIATPYRSHVWTYKLWITYVKNLAFMADTDTAYPATSFQFANVIIDGNPYYKSLTIGECETVEGSYYLSGADLYIHFTHHHPPFMFFSLLYGTLHGYTNKTVRRFNQNTYLPEVISVPGLSESVDPVEYSRMAFKSGSATLRNFIQTFDTQTAIFGNDFNVKVGNDTGDYGDLIPLQKYYIENYGVKLGDATFSLKDKRELLSIKCPSAMFNATTYPNIDTNVAGKIIPDAYGQLYGVPGFCVNGLAGNVNKVFKFANVITSVSSIKIYKDEQWTTVSEVSHDYANGTITLSVANAHDAGDYTKGIVKVKIDGVFRPEANPGDIIQSINLIYGNILINDTQYNLTEWESELRPLADIGLYMNASKDIYEWIEQIQNASTIGFQYDEVYGIRTARLDNPNRTLNAKKITPIDIVNIEEVEIDYNATLYASSAKIGYAGDRNENAHSYYVNDTYKQDVIDIHRKENEYKTDSLLQTEALAIAKSEVIMDDMKQIRPIYRGVKVNGLEWIGIRLYDILEADISVPGVSVVSPYIFDVDVIQLISRDVTEIDIAQTDYDEIWQGHADYEILEFVGVESTEEDDYDEITYGLTDYDLITFMGVRSPQVIKNSNREFAGNVRCQVIGKSVDLETMNVTLDLRQRDYSTVIEDLIGA